MKLILFVFFLFPSFFFSQAICTDCSFVNASFDGYDSIQCFQLEIDTSNLNNVWQIGSPNKQVFTTLPYSQPNVIVTDTANSYPVNDTSVFEIKTSARIGACNGDVFNLSGEYFVDSDSLMDYGKIEFSPDNGTTWVDLLRDTILCDSANFGGTMEYYYWIPYNVPVLTGRSGGWNYFYIDLHLLGPFFNLQCGDTLIYKFTFISDSIQTNRDGLMFDYFFFNDLVEGIEEYSNQFSSTCFPNPTNENLTIKYDNESQNRHQLKVFDQTGRLVYSAFGNSSNFTMSTGSLKSGFYSYKLLNPLDHSFSVGKFIKE